MGITITDVAKAAGVSIATVSHVINKTRYVSPELVEKIERMIKDTGYNEKLVIEKNSQFRIGKKSEIALVIPNTYSVVYTNLIVSTYHDWEVSHTDRINLNLSLLLRCFSI